MYTQPLISTLAGANKLRKRNREKIRVLFVSCKRVMLNGKLRLIDKDISDYAEGRTREEVIEKLKQMKLWQG